MTFGLLFLWPFVFLFLSMMFGCVLSIISTENCCRIWKIPGKIWGCINCFDFCKFKSCCMNLIFCSIPILIIYLVILCLTLIAWLLVIAFYAIATLFIGGLIYAFIVIPTWILIWFSFFRKLYLWNGIRTYTKNKSRALLQVTPEAQLLIDQAQPATEV